MLDELRIQCPSCGIVLDVRNSKHEAVKRITCPHCQKSLAVDFQEEEKPKAQPKTDDALYYIKMRIGLQEGVNQIELPGCEYLEIKVVRLKDGQSKCLVRALQEDHVTLNGETLEKDDQVALTKGDTIQTDETVLVFNQPGSKAAEKPEPVKSETPKPKVHVPQWLYALVAAVVALFIVWSLWPSNSKSPSAKIVQTKVIDSTRHSQKKQDSLKSKTKLLKSSDQQVGERNASLIKSHHAMSDYELEQQVRKGDVEAQYELGYRLVHKSGSNNVIRGIKYLRLAANQGSSKASSVLGKAINTLQRKAEAGDSVADNILMSIGN